MVSTFFTPFLICPVAVTGFYDMLYAFSLSLPKSNLGLFESMMWRRPGETWECLDCVLCQPALDRLREGCLFRVCLHNDFLCNAFLWLACGVRKVVVGECWQGSGVFSCFLDVLGC